MRFTPNVIGALAVLLTAAPVASYTVRYSRTSPPSTLRSAEAAVTTMMMSAEDAPDPTNFREAEVLGLRLMQEGNFDEALVGTSILACSHSRIQQHIVDLSWLFPSLIRRQGMPITNCQVDSFLLTCSFSKRNEITGKPTGCLADEITLWS